MPAPNVEKCPYLAVFKRILLFIVGWTVMSSATNSSRPQPAAKGCAMVRKNSAVKLKLSVFGSP